MRCARLRQGRVTNLSEDNVVLKLRLAAASCAAALSVALVAAGSPLSAVAANVTNPNSAIGYPVFSGPKNPVPASGVAYDPSKSYLQSVFDRDVANGAGTSPAKDFWVDKTLARYGTDPDGSAKTASGKSYTYPADGNDYLFTRGRAAFLRTHDPKVLGFGGQVAYWDVINGKEAYSIAVSDGSGTITLTEDTSKRKQTPSYWQSTFTGGGITVVETKYITDDNVLVTGLALTSTSNRTVTLTATSPLTSHIAGAELTGTTPAMNNVTTIRSRFSGNGMTPQGTSLVGTVNLTTGQTTTTKVQLGLTTPEIPTSTSSYEAIATGALKDPAASYKAHVTAYNRWWAENIPYIQSPDQNIDKTVLYRWWLTRFNSLDANAPGNVLQFPTSIEGVLGYDNAIDLTIGMFLDDMKWLRDPTLAYGTWVSAGETAGSAGQYRDNPADPSNWGASHTQFITEQAWASYQIHGGPKPIAEQLGRYGADDTKGQLATLDSNKDGLLDTNWVSWTGNDTDAVSFAEHPGSSLDRAESAYMYSNAQAAASAYRAAGDTANAAKMDAAAASVKKAVLNNLWDSKDKLVEHKWVNGPAAGQFAKWKEVNNYDPYAVGLMPTKGDADYNDDYDSALRLFADADEFPVFPFFTANQKDKAASGTGTNNFSVINSQVLFRVYQEAIRKYHAADNGYITPEQFKKLLYWNAFAHYQGGDNRYPDQNEFWADGSAADGGSINYRSWIHHTQLGSTNWTMIEDVAGLQTRDDSKIELNPIAMPGWGHFTVNNLSYRGKNLSIVWNGDGTYANAPKGYSLWISGKRVFTANKLGHLIYDPATGRTQSVDGSVTVTGASTSSVPATTAVSYGTNSRVVDIFAKAGTNIDPAATNTTNLARGATITASSTASGANRAATTATDGSTVDQGFWAPAASDATPSLTVDFGTAKKIDDIRPYFYQTSSSATEQGFAEPAQYKLEYWTGSSWKAIPSQARTPAAPQANYNRVQFPSISTTKIRATFTPQPGLSVGVKELEAYNTGIAAPASTNQAPQVQASVGQTQGGKTSLGGIVKDDGLPSGTLTQKWTQTSGPAGGVATFLDATAANTRVSFSKAGTYVLTLTASDGEKQSSDSVTVEGAPSTGTLNVAPDASSITASETAGWNNIKAVNDGAVFTSGSDNSTVWGTWSPNRPASEWLQYDWAGAIPLQSASITFWHDNVGPNSGNNVAPPQSWKLQSWDPTAANGAGAWQDVPLAAGSEYAVSVDGTNSVKFAQPIMTSKLRAVLNAQTDGTTNAAVAVSEFTADTADPTAIAKTDVATTTGTQPTLPATVDAMYDDGTHQQLPVTWPTIDGSQLATEGEFDIQGTVLGATSSAPAKVWVRSSLANLALNGTVKVDQTIHTGAKVQLPSTVTGIYNNGINRSGLPVVWNARDLAAVDSTKVGDYTVNGTATDTLDPRQTTTAQAVIHVVDSTTTPPSVNTAPLQSLYDANKDKAQSTYSDTSWKAFSTALQKAAAVLATPGATQQEVDAATDALQTSIAALQDAPPVPTITGMTITHPATKTSYRVGEKFDDSGLVVKATLSDGTQRTLPASEYNVSQFDSARPGSVTVVLTAVADPAVTASFMVTITAPTGIAPGTSSPATPPATEGSPATGGTVVRAARPKGELGYTGADGQMMLALLITAGGAIAAGCVLLRRRMRTARG